MIITSHVTLAFLLCPPHMDVLMACLILTFMFVLMTLALDWWAIFAARRVFATMVRLWILMFSLSHSNVLLEPLCAQFFYTFECSVKGLSLSNTVTNGVATRIDCQPDCNRLALGVPLGGPCKECGAATKGTATRIDSPPVCSMISEGPRRRAGGTPQASVRSMVRRRRSSSGLRLWSGAAGRSVPCRELE